MSNLFEKILHGQTERVNKKYGEKYGTVYINLWKQRTLRTAVAEQVSDFQAHLIEVMIDRFDDKVEQKYGFEFSIQFKSFLSFINYEKMFKEQNMSALVKETVKLLEKSAAEHRTSVQQETYTYFTQCYDI